MTTPAWILQSKLAPPAIARAVPRAWAAEVASKRAVAYVAPPGYGKTFAMAEAAADADHPVVWFTADPDDDLATCFHYLVAGARAHVPDLGAETLALLAGEEPEPRKLWRSYFGELAAYNMPAFTLVIDDAHHLQAGCPEVLTALLGLVERLPEGFRVRLASRRRPGGAIARLRASGALALVEADRLRFGADEEQAFLEGRGLAGREGLSELVAGLDGWPLGLRLATDRPDGRWDGALVAEYVAEELVEARPASTRRFMLQAALLTEPTAAAMASVFGVPDAEKRLAELESEQLIASAGEAYRFPAYLREFLEAEAARAWSAAEVAEWRRKAGDYLLGAGRAEAAAAQFMAASAWPEAIEAMARCFPAMRYDGRQALAARWLAALPAELADAEPAIALWRGVLFARRGEPAEAVPLFERAARGYEARGDAAGAFKAHVNTASALAILEDAKRAGALMIRLLGRQRDGLDEDRVDLHLIRARVAEQRGDLALMRECNEAVLAIPAAGNVEIAASHCIALLNMFTHANHRGDFGEARRHVERAIEAAEAGGLFAYRLFALFLRAHLQLIAGELEPVRQLLAELPSTWQETLDWHDRACALLVIGQWHQLQGAFKEAEEAFQRAMAIFERAGHQEGVKLPLERLLWLAVQRRQPARALELMAPLTQPGWPHDDALASPLDLALAPPYARALHLAGRPEAALDVLARAIPAIAEQGARYVLVRARLFEAAARLGTGDLPGAAAAREMALADAADYGFLLRQDAAFWEELAPLDAPAPALAPGIEPAPAIAETAPAPAPPAEPKRGQTLSITCFGVFEARLDGVLVDQWPRKKSKLILAALAIYPRGLTLAALAEMLGPEEAVTAGSMKMSLSALRKTLEPTLDAREPSRFVVLADDRYQLRGEHVAAVDVQAFDAAIAEASRLAPNEPIRAAERYEAALSLYHGGLLGDGWMAAAFEAERAQYRRRATGALEWLATYHTGRGDFTSAEAALLRLAEIDPCEEGVYLALMRFYRDRGRPERIRQVYWDCRKALKARLGMAPSEAFEAGHRAIAGARA